MNYKSPKGVPFSFDGWQTDETPFNCFCRKDYLGCLHGCLLALTLLGNEHRTQVAISDDGLVHELVHLAGGVEISTHTDLDTLRSEVLDLQNDLLRRGAIWQKIRSK